jgi:hypothetical protein
MSNNNPVLRYKQYFFQLVDEDTVIWEDLVFTVAAGTNQPIVVNTRSGSNFTGLYYIGYSQADTTVTPASGPFTSAVSLPATGVGSTSGRFNFIQNIGGSPVNAVYFLKYIVRSASIKYCIIERVSSET